MTERSHQAAQPQPTRSPVRTWLGYLLIAFAILFAVVNLEEVEVDWIIGTWETPLVVVILLCLALGAGVGWVAARRHSAR